MKKITILLCVFIMASCSSDGGGNEWADMDYGGGFGSYDLDIDLGPSFQSITITSECGNAESEKEYCVSGSTWDEVLNVNNTRIDVCTEITFKDLDGNSHTGLYKSTIFTYNEDEVNCQ
ncbi:MAG: hypothetical protein IZT56_15225 [Bacteroidetes bacterium]|nr:hypothetical protein [Bacteroidota bacterium]